MGGINPDRAVSPPRPMWGMTFSEARAQKWTVRTRCQRCGIVLRVNLDVVIKTLGADAIPWGRSPPCPVVSDNRFPCEGRMIYLARATRHGSWRSMARPPSVDELDGWRARTSGRTYSEIKEEREQAAFRAAQTATPAPHKDPLEF